MTEIIKKQKLEVEPLYCVFSAIPDPIFNTISSYLSEKEFGRFIQCCKYLHNKSKSRWMIEPLNFFLNDFKPLSCTNYIGCLFTFKFNMPLKGVSYFEKWNKLFDILTDLEPFDEKIIFRKLSTAKLVHWADCEYIRYSLYHGSVIPSDTTNIRKVIAYIPSIPNVFKNLKSVSFFYHIVHTIPNNISSLTIYDSGYFHPEAGVPDALNTLKVVQSDSSDFGNYESEGYLHFVKFIEKLKPIKFICKEKILVSEKNQCKNMKVLVESLLKNENLKDIVWSGCICFFTYIEKFKIKNLHIKGIWNYSKHAFNQTISLPSSITHLQIDKVFFDVWMDTNILQVLKIYDWDGRIMDAHFPNLREIVLIPRKGKATISQNFTSFFTFYNKVKTVNIQSPHRQSIKFIFKGNLVDNIKLSNFDIISSKFPEQVSHLSLTDCKICISTIVPERIYKFYVNNVTSNVTFQYAQILTIPYWFEENGFPISEVTIIQSNTIDVLAPNTYCESIIIDHTPQYIQERNYSFNNYTCLSSVTSINIKETGCDSLTYDFSNFIRLKYLHMAIMDGHLFLKLPRTIKDINIISKNTTISFL